MRELLLTRFLSMFLVFLLGVGDFIACPFCWRWGVYCIPVLLAVGEVC